MKTGSVLVVDDEATTAIRVRDLLARELPEAEVLSCTSFPEAVAMVRRRNVNVVITDMHDPTESAEAGYKLILVLKKANPATQIVVYTAYAEFENAVRCMRAGCYEYISKGTDPRRLLRAAREAFELAQGSANRDALGERLILADWETLSRSSTRAEKGEALESLCSSLFQAVPGWQRIDARVRTKTEEIDLVILNESTEVFWREFGNFILVECKYWERKKKPGRVDFDAFHAKLARRGVSDCRLGFFISMNGFTKTFEKELDRIAKEPAVIVPLCGEDLWALICDGDRSKWLKQSVASQSFR